MRKTEGITLIALVITIIVLLILAGVAISMLSGENGILKQAAKAKTEMDKETTIETVKLVGINALTASHGSVENEEYYKVLNNELKELGYDVSISKGKLPIENIEINGEHFNIKENGEVLHTVWYYVDGNKEITNGKITLKIGDIITNYNSAIDKNGEKVTKQYTSPKEKNGYGDQKFTAESYTGKWAVLGAEDGQLLIMPTTNVTTSSNEDGKMYLGYNKSKDNTSALRLENTKKALQYAVQELDEICKVYGYGKGAIKARSIKEEDINKVTGFNPYSYCQGLLYGYGNKVTYKMNNDNKVECTWYKNKVLQKEEPSDRKTFVYFNGNEWKRLSIGESTTLRSTYYWYFPQTLSTSAPDTTETIGIASDSNEYKMLFKEGENNTNYWVGSSYLTTSGVGSANFGIRNVEYSRVRGYQLFNSMDAYNNSESIRTRC